MSDNKTHGKSIGCDVENCAYNEHGTGCSAQHIKVDGKSAKTTDGTRCSTFKQKGGANF